MDATKYAESDFVCVDLISSLENKTGVVVDVSVEQTKFGERMKVSFEFGGKRKSWNPPRDVLKSFIIAWTSDTMRWAGKKVHFAIMNGKVIATPIMDHVASLLQQEKV
jgi:hypothetical protein